MKNKKRIDELVNALNKAGKSYYQEDREIMTNFEYDNLYDELLFLEMETGYVPEDSPSKNVGYQLISDLEKIVHEYPALSLDKTKEPDALIEWLGERSGMLSWKLDGLTVQLTYDGGRLTRAVTRGDGEVGEDVTHNAIYFRGVPKTIPFTGHFVCRGEALITYQTFERINEALDPVNQYKNPRNLASGSVRQLDSKASAGRGVEFNAFKLIYADGKEIESVTASFEWLKGLGFTTVEYETVDASNLLEKLKLMESRIKSNNHPSDGLVLTFDDILYGKSLGSTGKYPRHSIAFKWQDETQKTKLLEVEWSPSRTGLINPVAIFEPVELEGTTVQRASVHNISIMESLQLGIGDTILVYKANMIIPQIANNISKSGTVEIPKHCPICGGETKVNESKKDELIVKTLHCMNKDCQIKHIKKFAHFVERERMNIDGLSEATLEKLIKHGLIKEYRDIYRIAEHKDVFISTEGQGEKSFDKLIRAIEKSRKVKLEKLIASLGISNVGGSTGKKISKALNGDLNEFHKKLESGNLMDIDDVGETSNNALIEWYKEEKKANETGKSEYFNLLKELEIITPEPMNTSFETTSLAGKTFVITGKLERFTNRAALVEKIESLGGTVSGSVSAKTHYLINNDATSNSSKNKKANELGVSIITETQFEHLVDE